jgi:hypothetical protein
MAAYIPTCAHIRAHAQHVPLCREKPAKTAATNQPWTRTPRGGGEARPKEYRLIEIRRLSQHQARDMQQTTCNRQLAPDNMQRTTCSRHICSRQRTTCEARPHSGPGSSRYAGVVSVRCRCEASTHQCDRPRSQTVPHIMQRTEDRLTDIMWRTRASTLEHALASARGASRVRCVACCTSYVCMHARCTRQQLGRCSAK